MADLTPIEKDFIIKALSEGVNLSGNYSQLVNTMNLIESICRKLSAAEASGFSLPPVAESEK